MHRHLAIETWSRRTSWLHQRDARAKLAVLLASLIAISTTSMAARSFHVSSVVYAVVLILGVLSARLPIAGLLLRAAWVLPFSLTFAVLVYWSGDAARATGMLEKSYLSAVATLLFVATTPLEKWTAGLDQWHCPRTLILVMQFLYRYLFLIADQAHRMMNAAELRRGVSKRLSGLRSPRSGFQSASGAVGVLFARSWQRSEAVYQAMCARGFTGRFPSAAAPRFRAADAVFLIAGLMATIAVRLLIA